MTRRKILQKAAGTFMILPAGLARGYAANEKLNVGVIGLAGMAVAGLAIAFSQAADKSVSDVLFSGDGSGNFVAFDATNGKPLWHSRIGVVSNGPST